MTGIIIYFVIAFVAGILSLLYGKKMFNALLAIYAFTMTYRFVLTKFPSDQYVLWIAIAAGILAIVLVKFAKNLTFFLLGAVIGALLGMAVVPFLPELPGYVSTCIVIGCAILLGFLMAHYNNTLIRFGTAYIGGDMISSATLLLIFGSATLPSMMADSVPDTIQNLAGYMYGSFASAYSLWILAGSIVLMFFGAAFQKKHA
jgi:hypothetical protein